MLTTDAETLFGVAGADDAFTATNLTYGTDDMLIDGSSSDSDTLTVTTATDITATPLVVGVENVNFTTAAVLAGGNTTLGIAVDELRAAAISADVTNTESLISIVDFTGAREGQTLTASDAFTTVLVDSVLDANVDVTINNTDATLTTDNGANDGVGTNLTVTAAGDLNINGTVEDGALSVNSSGSLTVTAANSFTGDLDLTATTDVTVTSATAAAGNVTVSAGGDVLVSAAAATGDAVITAGGTVGLTAALLEGDVTVTSTAAAESDVTLTTVAAAEGTVTVNAAGTITVTDATAATAVVLDNTGAAAGDGITITDADSATTVTVTSVGAVTATGTSIAAAETITVTAARDSAITADTVADQVITLNAENEDGDTITFTLQASTVETLNLGGSSDIVVDVDVADIDTETVTTTNTATSTLYYSAAASADITEVASGVQQVLGADFGAAPNTLTVNSSSDIRLDAEVGQTTNAVVFDHETDATTSTSNTLTVAGYDSVDTNTDVTLNALGLAFTDVQGLTFALGEFNLASTGDITGADLETVTVTGGGDFDLGANTITGDGTNRVTLDASASSGDVTMTVDGTTDAVNQVTTGSGVDAITIDGIAGSDDGFVLATNGGADIFTVTTNGDGATAVMSLNGGTGIDTLVLNTGVDISDSDVTLTSVETISVEGGANNSATVSSNLLSGNTLIIDATAGAASETLNIVVDALTVDFSTLAFAANFSEAGDIVAIDGSALGISVDITGTGEEDQITGGTGADVIDGGAGDDVITGGAGADVLTGGDGADTFVMDSKATTDTILDFVSADDTIQISVAAIDNTATDLATALAGDADGVANSEVATATELLIVANEAALAGGSLAATTVSEALIYVQDTGELYLNDAATAGVDELLVQLTGGTALVLADVSFIA